jgi:signal recognition particle receptor subunit beta
MVLFNYSTKELTAKIVYYGPGLCGKTTNLQWVHEKIPIKNKGKMLSLATEADRTLFFDFLPIDLGTIRGMKTRVQLYTVPGQVFYNATRRMVLKGADCVVFVADSQEAMLDANLGALENLRENLEANEIDPDEIPTVIQYNKRDLPNALPVDVLQEKLNTKGWPHFTAIAMTGEGVEETLKAATALVFKTLSGKYGAAPARPKLSPPKPPPPAPEPAPAPAPEPEPAPPAPEPPPIEPEPAAPPIAPEPPPLDLDAPAPEPVTPSADSLLDSLESAPSPGLDLGETTEPVIPSEPELTVEPELEPEPAPVAIAEPEPAPPETPSPPELELEPEPAAPVAAESPLDSLDVGEPAPEPAPEPELEFEPDAVEPELELESAPEEPELTLEPDELAAPVLDIDATAPPAAPTPESAATLPPAAEAAPPEAAPEAGAISLDVPASPDGGEVVVPIQLNVAEGTTQAQVQLRITLKLQIEK